MVARLPEIDATFAAFVSGLLSLILNRIAAMLLVVLYPVAVPANPIVFAPAVV